MNFDAKEGGVFIQAGTGNDSVLGGSGRDIILGGSGRDYIFGGKDNDIILSGQGDDIVLGGSGNDLIYSDSGNDRIFGGEGEDIINPGKGNDMVFGNGGADVFEFARADLDAEFTNEVGDFQVGVDKLVITGISDNDNTTFDSNTGYISVNGDVVISLKDLENGEDLEMKFQENGDFEIM